MATLTEYLKHLQEKYKPHPTPEPETDIPIEGEPISDIEQKAAAFDYLTGRSDGNE